MLNQQLKVKVKGSQRSEVEPLNSIDNDTFYVSWEENDSWSLQFTARDDGSLAYKMLDSEASIFFDGQEYIIKQVVPDYIAGQKVKDVTAPHVYTELSRVRIYKDYVDDGDEDSKGKDTDAKVAGSDEESSSGDNSDDSDKAESTTTQNGNTKTTVTRTDESDGNDENQVSYSIQDVLDKYLKDNKFGFTSEVIGRFDKERIEEITEGSGMDMLSTITDHWPDAIIYPDNRNIRIYSRDEFEIDHENRLNYQYDTTEFKLTYDSTGLTNQVLCIGAKYSVETDTETTTTSSSAGGSWGWPFPSVGEGTFSQAQKFGYDGGYRQNSFHDGVDFGSIDHPGSEVHAIHGGVVTNKAWASGGINYYVVTHSDDGYYCEYQEAFGSMSNITVNVGDKVKTGDIIGYRNTDHLHVGVTKSPLPGAFSHAFSNDGTWLDPIALIKSGGSDSGSSDGESSSTSKSSEYYYFRPFFASDDDSIKKYGVHPMEPLEDGRFKDKDAMRKYALSKLQPEPTLSVEATTFLNFKPIAGDKTHILIKDAELSTNLAVVGFNWYAFSETQATTITLNTNAQNIIDYQNAQNKLLKQSVIKTKQSTDEAVSRVTSIVDDNNYWTQEEVNTFGANLELSSHESSNGSTTS